MNESQAFYPTISPDGCDGCSECVGVCPGGALGLIDGLAVLVSPARCIYCGDCEDHCPQGAISLPYEIVVDSITWVALVG